MQIPQGKAAQVSCPSFSQDAPGTIGIPIGVLFQFEPDMLLYMYCLTYSFTLTKAFTVPHLKDQEIMGKQLPTQVSTEMPGCFHHITLC